VSTDGRIAIGDNVGNLQGESSIAIGTDAGLTGQNDFCVAIGFESGKQNQSKDSVAIGSFAAEIDQGLDAIAIGLLAGNDTQSQSAIAIGNEAGQSAQGISAIAIGEDAGNDNQGQNAIAIGLLSGSTSQGTNSIAIGNNAGLVNLGASSIAIGNNSGTLNQAANSIILNATGSALNSSVSSSTTISPIAQKASGTFNMLLYNDTTKEVVKSSAATSAFNKTFVIEHPKDESKYLVHACLEGPEAGVYYRGKAEIIGSSVKIDLPHYLDKLACDFTVQITPIYSKEFCKSKRILCAEEISTNCLVVHDVSYSERASSFPCKFYWTVFGKRKDIDVEPSKNEWELKGDGPYTYLVKKDEVKQDEVKQEVEEVVDCQEVEEVVDRQEVVDRVDEVKVRRPKPSRRIQN
jgi:hypothetical protein